jgi:hypothetical protein
MTPDDDMRWDAHSDFIEEDVLWEQDNTYISDRFNDMEDMR